MDFKVLGRGVESWADFQELMVLQSRTPGPTSQPSRVKFEFAVQEAIKTPQAKF